MANFASDAIFRHIEECFIYDGGGSLQALSGRPWKETYAGNVLAMHKTSTFTPLFNCMYTYQWHTTPFLVSLDNLTLVLGKPGPIYMRRQVRANKTKALVDEVEMLQANPYYAHVRYPDSRKTTDGHQATCTSRPNQIVTTSWHALQATENTSQVEDSTETRMNLPVRRSERVCGSVVSLDLWRGKCCMP